MNEGDGTHLFVKDYVTFEQELYMIAGCSSNEEVIFALAFNCDSRVRMRVAENPNAPIAILARLAFDVDPEVRLAVTEHPGATRGVLEILVNDEDPDVRYGLAENANLPSYILRMLSEDENPYVSSRARKTLKRLAIEKDGCSFFFPKTISGDVDDRVLVAAV